MTRLKRSLAALGLARNRNVAANTRPGGETAQPAPASPELIASRIKQLFAEPPAEWTDEQQVFLARALSQLDLLSEIALHALLRRFLSNRKTHLIRSLVNDESLGLDLVRDYYRLRLSLYSGDDVIDLDDVTSLYRRAQGSFLRYRVLNQLLTFAAQRNATELIETVLSSLRPEEYNRLTNSVVAGVLRLLIRSERYEPAATLLTYAFQRTSPVAKLYYLEPLLALDKQRILSPALSAFCARFRESPGTASLEYIRETYEAVDANDRENLERFVLEPLSSLPQGKSNLMDLRFQPQQKQRLIETIKRHLAEERAMSLLRLGDGEAYAYEAPALRDVDPSLFTQDNEVRARVWWGTIPPSLVANDIATRVRDAVIRCDVLGLPSVHRLVRDFPASGRPFGGTRPQRGLAAILAACAREVPLADKILTEERCHQVALDEAVLANLASVAKTIIVVSCWAPEDLSLKLPDWEHIQVPPAQKLRREGDADTPPLFEVYPQILKRVRETATPGTLVLVGAGIIGKILADEAREAGAVAIDVGSMLDYMAGSKTRSIADLI